MDGELSTFPAHFRRPSELCIWILDGAFGAIHNINILRNPYIRIHLTLRKPSWLVSTKDKRDPTYKTKVCSKEAWKSSMPIFSLFWQNLGPLIFNSPAREANLESWKRWIGTISAFSLSGSKSLSSRRGAAASASTSPTLSFNDVRI